MCKTCEGFPHDRAKQDAFVMDRVRDGRYRYEAAQFDLYCIECGHAGVWPPEGATDESRF